MKQFSANHVFCWPPGSGGHFLIHLLYPDLVKKNSSNEFVPKGDIVAGLNDEAEEKLSKDPESINQFIKQFKTKNYPVLGFHQLPKTCIEKGYLDQYIKTKKMFVVTLDPEDAEFCLLLAFVKKYTWPAFSDNILTWNLIQSIVSYFKNKNLNDYHMYKWIEYFDEFANLENILLHDYFSSYADKFLDRNNVSCGRLHVLAKCLDQGKIPTMNFYKDTIKDEFESHPDITYMTDQYHSIDLSNSAIEIEFLPYKKIFFGLDVPIEMKKINYEEKILQYSMNNLIVAESFIKKLDVKPILHGYINKMKNKLQK